MHARRCRQLRLDQSSHRLEQPGGLGIVVGEAQLDAEVTLVRQVGVQPGVLAEPVGRLEPADPKALQVEQDLEPV
jgi:hypothetical protein